MFRIFQPDSDAAGKHKQLPVISKEMINFSTDKGLFEMSAIPLHLKIHGKTLFSVLSDKNYFLYVKSENIDSIYKTKLTLTTTTTKHNEKLGIFQAFSLICLLFASVSNNSTVSYIARLQVHWVCWLGRQWQLLEWFWHVTTDLHWAANVSVSQFVLFFNSTQLYNHFPKMSTLIKPNQTLRNLGTKRK